MNDLIVGLLLIFGPSTAYVLWLGYQAHRGNPAVVEVECPLRVGTEFRAELETEARDLALWDAEVGA